MMERCHFDKKLSYRTKIFCYSMVTTHKHSQTYAHQTLQTYNKQQIELSYTNVDVSYVSSRFETPTDV